jgi:hypothetical protein
MMVEVKKNVIIIVIVIVKKHAQHEHATTPNKADGTKCLETLIRHHGMDVKSRKSINLVFAGRWWLV